MHNLLGFIFFCVYRNWEYGYSLVDLCIRLCEVDGERTINGIAFTQKNPDKLLLMFWCPIYCFFLNKLYMLHAFQSIF